VVVWHNPPTGLSRTVFSLVGSAGFVPTRGGDPEGTPSNPKGTAGCTRAVPVFTCSAVGRPQAGCLAVLWDARPTWQTDQAVRACRPPQWLAEFLSFPETRSDVDR
jgi:hypothetical protein